MRVTKNAANMMNEKNLLLLIGRPEGKRMPLGEINSAGNIILK
jgi:hypothetical protein